METYRTVPSFSADNDKYHALSKSSNSLPTVTMTWDSSKNKYIGTIKDTNGTEHAEYFKNLTNSYKIDVSTSKSGGTTTYTFSCNKSTGDVLKEKTITMGKEPGVSTLAIYEAQAPNADDQTLITGAYDYVEYYVNLEIVGNVTGDGTIEKELSLNGKPYTPDNKAEVLGSLSFQISDSATNFTGSHLQHFTGSAGNYTYSDNTNNTTSLKLNTSTGKALLKDLPEGRYYVREQSLKSDYTLVGPTIKILDITDGSTTATNIVVFDNGRNPGDGRIIKTFVNDIDTLTTAQKTALYKQVTFTVRQGNQYVHATGSAGNYTFSGVSTIPQSFSLNNNGQLVIETLPTGTYTVTESSTASDYTPSNTTQTLNVTKDNTSTATFRNAYNKINVTIKKAASDGIISGIRFRVQNSTGSYNQVFTTNENGVIEIKGIDPDTYTVTELDHDGYDIKPSNPQTKACTTANTAYTFSLSNIEQLGDLTVRKDITNLSDGADKSRLIEGITFTLKGTSTSGKTVNRTATTNAQGVATFTDVPIGDNYTLTETLTGNYWTGAVTKNNVPIEWNATGEISVGNKLAWGDVTVYKEIVDDGGYADPAKQSQLDAGLTFRLYGTSDAGISVDVTATTDSDGVARFTDIFVGTYRLEEVTNKPFFDNWSGTTVTVVDKDNNPTANPVTITATNALKEGNLVVTKTAEDGLVEGLKFRLTSTSLSGLKVDVTATVEADGKAYFNNIPIGDNYTLQEIDTPIRFVQPIDENGVAINWNETTGISISNMLKKFNVTLTKRDSDSNDGMSHGGAVLAGAVYGIYRNGVLVDEYTTNSNGKFTTKDYVCDTWDEVTPDVWTVKEITPSEGYLLDETVYTLDTDPANFTNEINPLALDVEEKPVYGWFDILKYTTDTVDMDNPEELLPESGAEFYVYLKFNTDNGDSYLDVYNKCENDERDILSTDIYGYAKAKQLRYGTYVVHQTKGADGKKFSADFEVVLDENNQSNIPNRHIPLINTPYSAKVRVVKKDMETGKTIPVSGVGFKVKNLDTDEYIVQHIDYPTPYDIDTYYTDVTGEFTLPRQLIVGHYQVEEVSAPYGYVLNTEPVKFNIVADNSTDGEGVTIEVIFSDVAQKGIINVSKSGEIFSSVTQNGNVYQPVYKGTLLAGAVYQIIAAEDIITLDGTVRAAKGEVVDTLITGADGKASSKELYLGSYTVKEITAPYGMVLNGTVHDVVLTYAEQNVSVTDTSTLFVNERQKVAVSLINSMEQDDVYDIGMNDEITSVQFGLYAAEALTASDGKTMPANALIETVTLKSGGKYTFTTDLPLGRYYLQEIATNEHYILSDTKYPVVFEYAGQDTAVVTLDPVKAYNEIGRVPVRIYKVDNEDKLPIEGALFGIFAPDETIFTEATAKRIGRTCADGTLTFEDVPYGNWIIREIQPAEGFLPNNNSYPVAVNAQADGTVISVNVENKWIKGNVVINKVDEDFADIPLSGAEFTVWKDVNGNGKYDSDVDTKVGTLTETNEGIYRLDGLRYGKYLIQETKAPAGFIRDTAYYAFSITENGVDVYVESAIASTAEDEFADKFTNAVIPPEIGTTATVEKEKEIFAVGEITIEDVVAYHDLIVGKEYTVTGVLMDKKTGAEYLVNGEPVTAEITFIAESEDGEAVVAFTFDTSGITLNTTVVAFETLYHNDIVLAVHADIEDEEQTVKIRKPKIKTEATVNGKKEIVTTGTVTIKDVASYKHLIPSNEYMAKGVLMDKSTGKSLLINGKAVTAETTFTAETESGEVLVEFTFNADGLTTDTEIVVYETLYHNEIEVAAHADIEDNGQTVTLRVPEIPDNPPTGVKSNLGLKIGLCGVGIGGIIAATIIFIKKKKEDESDDE